MEGTVTSRIIKQRKHVTEAESQREEVCRPWQNAHTVPDEKRQSGAALGFHLLGFRKAEVFLPNHGQDRHGKWKRGALAYLSRGEEHGTLRDQLTKKTPKGDTKLHCKRRGVAAGGTT